MSKVGLIIKREYTTRVRNKTFILLTFLAPIFYGILLLMPLLATQLGKETREVKVVDFSGKFKNVLPNSQRAHFSYFPVSDEDPEESLEAAKQTLKKEGADHYVLYIPNDIDAFETQGIQLYSQKNVGAGFQLFIDSLLANRITDIKMQSFGIKQSTIDSIKTNIDVELIKYTEKGLQKSSSGATTAASFIGGFLIYIFIFLYGGLVLRGVQEEKSNRVVEIIISSVKPFQLMIGKIIGIALVGLSQFLVWVLLTLAVTALAGNAMAILQGADAGLQAQGAEAQSTVASAADAINTLNLPLLIGMFMFFFIGGYLLYSSLFAAFAAAVDSQTDIYQFMFPISLPIVFAITLIPAIIENPDSGLAVALSIIPFTSPVIMMARLPFDVPAWQILASMAALISGFLLTTWLAAKIYRIGILMYGKKITYKEMLKWLTYRA
ncbi:MAG: ABC transporter permease [Sphingobacteriales bacterium]|nr:MAG: ABC transporter permease [Sphingobacteriales bacterium]